MRVGEHAKWGHRPMLARAIAVSLALALAAAPARAQSNFQLWGTVTLDWVKSDRLAYELDFEPQVLLAAPEGDPAWRSFNVTPDADTRRRSGSTSSPNFR